MSVPSSSERHRQRTRKTPSNDCGAQTLSDPFWCPSPLLIGIASAAHRRPLFLSVDAVRVGRGLQNVYFMCEVVAQTTISAKGVCGAGSAAMGPRPRRVRRRTRFEVPAVGDRSSAIPHRTRPRPLFPASGPRPTDCAADDGPYSFGDDEGSKEERPHCRRRRLRSSASRPPRTSRP